MSLLTGVFASGSALLLLLAFLLSCTLPARAGDPTEQADVGLAEADVRPPALDFRILDQGGPRMVTTNWGYIGNYGNRLIDANTGQPAVPLEYPAGSRITYLYDAGLWIGGIVGNDTVVSTGSLSYWARHELFPDTGAAGKLVFDDHLADAGYRAAYADTITDPNIVGSDRIDGLHRPLPVVVHQETRAWADTNYHELIWVHLSIANIGAQTIRDAFVGWQVDPDVYHLDNRYGYADDLAGFHSDSVTFHGERFGCAGVYVIDNDGDPDTVSGFTDRSPTGALGLALVSGSPIPSSRSFNWWITSYYPALDWGPHRPSPDPDVPADSGRPQGDAARYRMMANGEIDYDQVFGGVDMTAEGWAPPPDTAFFAAGFDIVFLHAAGPWTIPPGDSVQLDFVWFVVPGIHTDPRHFAETFSFEDPQPFLDGLDFSMWEQALASAHHLGGSGFSAAAPGPPQDFRLESWTTTEATLAWRPKHTFTVAGYGVFRRDPEGTFPDQPVGNVGPSDSMFTDGLLATDAEYYYSIRASSQEAGYGPPSPEVSADLRIPMAVALHDPIPANGTVTLTWDRPEYPDIAGYHVERLEETAPGETTQVVLGRTTALQFTDDTPVAARIYEYAVRAESGAGVLGRPSRRVRGMVMMFDGGPLVIDQTLADPSGLTNKDSVRAFWQRVLPEAIYRDEDRERPTQLALRDFNAHPVTIVVSSGKFSETRQVRDLLRDYFLAWGSVLFVGRDLFNLDNLPYGTRLCGPGDFEYDFLGLTRIYYPPTLLSHPTRMNAEFAAARSCSAELPDLRVDSARSDWGVPPQLQPVGPAIPFVGWVEGDPARSRCLYSYESRYADTSSSQGKTCALLFDDGRRRAAILNFPLEMMEEANAAVALRTMVSELGFAAVRPGDFDGDGAVTPVDIARIIAYLFGNGYPPVNMRNADVNTDCRTNLMDVVVLVNYLYRGGPPPAPGCAV